MLFISFTGIKSDKGDYIVEVSNTAEGEPRIMNVSEAFYMQIPVEMLTKNLDTARNDDLSRQQEAQSETRFVKTLRRRHGDKMISGESVCYDTHLYMMEVRNILKPSSIIDKDGVPRYAPKGASYETVSMTCPIGSHLVGFATRLNQPAMLFMTPQATEAKRSEDKENDSILRLENEVRESLYSLDELQNPSQSSFMRSQMQAIAQSLEEDVQRSAEQAAELNEMKMIGGLSQMIGEGFKLENAKQRVKTTESILREYEDIVRQAEGKQRHINYIVTTIKKSWDEIQARKTAPKEEKKGNRSAIVDLLIEGDYVAQKDIVDAALPIEGEMQDLMKAERALQQVADAEQRNQSQRTARAPRRPDVPVVPYKNILSLDDDEKPTEPDGKAASVAPDLAVNQQNAGPVSAPEAEEKKAASPVASPESGKDVETDTTTVPADAEKNTASPVATPKSGKDDTPDNSSSSSTPVVVPTPPPPTFMESLRSLAERANTALTEAVVAMSRVEALVKEAEKDIESIQDIVKTVKSARVQRNREIVNWPNARDLISKSKSGLEQGYNHWRWFYTDSPNLVVKYIFNLMQDTGRWDDVTFTGLSQEPLPVYSVPLKQQALNSYHSMLMRLRPKTNGRLALSGDLADKTRDYLLGKPSKTDAFTRLLPRPQLFFRTRLAGEADAELAQEQVIRLFHISEQVRGQVSQARQEMNAVIEERDQLIRELKESKESGESKELVLMPPKVMDLQAKIQLMELRVNRLTETEKRAHETLELADNLARQKRERITNRNADSSDEEEKPAACVVELTPAEEAQYKVEMGLRTALSLSNKKDEFFRLLGGVGPESELVKSLKKYCEDKPRLLKRFNEYMKELSKKVAVSAPTMRPK